MKRIIIIAVALICACNHSQPSRCNTDYTIDIWNINASMAYTTLYHINGDSVLIKFINEVEGGRDSLLLKRSLTEVESASICKYLSSFNIDTLKADYINSLVEDGDQKKIRLHFGKKSKTVNMSNFYQKDIGGLYEVVNDVINDDRYKIKYKK